MPIYEYRCHSCGHEMEVMQKMSEDALKECPVCAQPQLKKLISASAFQLKGSGWYQTDFKGSNKKDTADAKADAPPSSESEGQSKPVDSSKTEAKAAPTSTPSTD